MREIEIKVLQIDKTEVLKRLKKLKSKKIFEGIMSVEYFDFPDYSLAKRHQILRLRTKKNKTFLTFKQGLKSKKTVSSNETEFETTDFKAAKKILQSFGLIPIIAYKKRRTSFALENAQIEIDEHLEKHKKIPAYLEIEAQNEKTVFSTLAKLGFSKKQAKKWHGFRVFSYYGFKLNPKMTGGF